MNKDINIFISCHKQCNVPQHELLYPIQVGTAGAEEYLPDLLHDNEGLDHISEKNPMYCELTAQYWVWKHVQAEYYGFFHYRRYMSFAEESFPHNDFQDVLLDELSEATLKKLNYDAEHMRRLIGAYDVIATVPVKLRDLNRKFGSNYDQYISKPYEYKEDIDLMMEIIKEKYPLYYASAHKYMFEIDYGYFCNMFIMKRELFQEYSAFLFDVLSEHEKRGNYRDYNVDGYRVSGYLGERLFGIYYLYLKEQKKYRTREVQRTLFANVEKRRRLPAGEKKKIPIVLAANESYIAYSSVLLASVLEHINSENDYEMIVLSHEIKESSKKKLKKLTAGYSNVSLRVLDPDELLKDYKLFTRAHFSVETYYRLVLPQFLPEYDKVLYLDVDMVAKADVAELYDIDIEGYLLGAVYDVDTAGLYNGFQPDKKKYMDEELQLAYPYNYFQAGVLLLNLAEFRKTFSMKQILDMAAAKQWQLLDQDILNKLCEGRVKYIDMSWNVIYDYGNIRIDRTFRLAPQWQYKMYMEARKHPKLIHFAGPEKPWQYPDCDFGEEFWEYARKSPFYECILYAMLAKGSKKRVTDDRMFEKKSNSPVYKTIRCLKLYGLNQTLRECKRELGKLVKKS